MTEQTFKPGDVVRIKHMRVNMTVEKDNAHLGVEVVWFDDSDRLQRDSFQTELLELVAS